MDEGGHIVLGPTGEPVLFPLEFNESDVLDAARSVRDFLENDSTISIGVMKATADLSKFRHGGEWDVQRISGRFISEHRDYSTIMIGRYAAIAGFSLNEILSIQNVFSRFMSKFAKNEAMDSEYIYLPVRNVVNTRIGYDLGLRDR